MKEIKFQIRDVKEFETIRDITQAMQGIGWDIPAGIRVLGGPTKDSDEISVQAWYFDTNRWTTDKAKKWMNKNEYYYYSVVEVAVPTANLLQALTTNFKGTVRHDTMEGRDYLVAPMVMLTIGVHQGSNGSLYYPEEELSKTPAVWNYKPIVVYHPEIDGAGVSACDPDILTSRKVGVVMKARYDNGKLKAEAWLEESRLKEVDDRVLNALEKGIEMELSTGLFTDNDMTEGTWNGETYTAIARNYRPDHLALLPDQIGACSLADGAGLLKLNKEAAQGAGAVAQAARAFLETYEENEKLLKNKGATNLPGKGEIDGVGKSGGGVLNSNQKKGDKGMDKEKFVNDLIKNSAAWDEEDREFLMGLDEKKLEKLTPPVVNEEEEKKQIEAKAKELLAANKVEEEKVAAKAKADEEAAKLATNKGEKKEPTVEEYVANAPEGIRDMLTSGMKAHEDEKAKFIKLVTENKANLFTEDQLKAKGLVELKALAALSTTPEQKKASPLYNGQGDPGVVTENKEEPLEAPVMDFSGKEGK